MRFRFALLILTISSSLLLSQDKKMKIEFLGMTTGCPNTPKMWKSLHSALHELNWSIAIDSLDLFELSNKEDVRAGYGSPTILVNGKDLFGAPLPTTFNPACRYYRGGVPGKKEIVAKLKLLKL